MWGWLIIPALALSLSVGYAPIVNGVHDTTQLGDGIAHLEYTTWGRTDAGRTVIIGHGDRAFRDLYTLQIGDDIGLMMNGYEIVTFTVYAMYWTTPDDTRLLTEPSDTYELVLITCSADTSHRLVVRARMN